MPLVVLPNSVLYTGVLIRDKLVILQVARVGVVFLGEVATLGC